ncbi:cathepsin L1 [Galendromus occidentalis]|uniref:Cathepsin L1 n=1 Tax=Galendromus occidentalis TaxID=34638 RepID=A0AAJ6VYD3_9ACAR|nr:cathepsin L1 [Galendromus occidentalis]
MKFLILAVLVGAASAALTLEQLFDAEWQNFKVHHNKKYEGSTVEAFRKKIFLQNTHLIARHNIKHAKGETTYKLKMNQFGDMLHHEFVSTMNGLLRSNRTYFGSTWIEPESVSLPKSVDWREKGAVTPVKNQGHCGSCWSFSTTGALEGQLFRKTGELVSLSEQNLIDCSTSYGNNGCGGGLMDNAFTYIKENHGIDTEESYPYEGKQGKCRYHKEDSAGRDTGFVDIPSGNERALAKALATIGPVSVAIDASHESFQFYHEGVYNPPDCDSHSLDHGVLAVGYGTTDDGQDYYIIKNSWGERWGQEGYVLMARNSKNECGVATQASYPLV